MVVRMCDRPRAALAARISPCEADRNTVSRRSPFYFKPAWCVYGPETYRPMEDVQFAALWTISGTLTGVASGWLVDRTVLHRLRSHAEHSADRADDIVAHALKGILPIGGGAVGCGLALRWTDLPMALEEPLGEGLFILGVFTICLVLARAIGSLLHHTTSKVMAGGSRSASILGVVTRASIFLVGSLVVLHDLGISITPMLTALGVGGLAVALALQDTLTNLFAGIQLLASRQLNVGDFVKLESGEEGHLVDITWRNTTIRALSNHSIVVPNAKLAASVLVNHQQPEPEEAVVMQVGVSYDSDLELVEAVTIDTAREVMRRVQPDLRGFDPFIRYHTFGDSSIGFSVIMRATAFTERYIVMHEFVKALHRRYREEGIEIPFPMRTLRIDPHPSLIHEH